MKGTQEEEEQNPRASSLGNEVRSEKERTGQCEKNASPVATDPLKEMTGNGQNAALLQSRVENNPGGRKMLVEKGERATVGQQHQVHEAIRLNGREGR